MALETASVRAVYVPFVYGSIAFWLGKRPSVGESTHKWSVYVRSADDMDLSYAIAKVTFKLHDTFANPVREFTSPPYCVCESGWGEFDVGIRITLRDPAAEPINVTHRLRLYSTVNVTDRPSACEEVYDEIVFNEMPSDPEIRDALIAGPTKPAPAYTWQEWFGGFSAEEDLTRIAAARTYLHDRALEMQDRLLRAQQEIEREKEEVRTLSGGFAAGTIVP